MGWGGGVWCFFHVYYRQASHSLCAHLPTWDGTWVVGVGVGGSGGEIGLYIIDIPSSLFTLFPN